MQNAPSRFRLNVLPPDLDAVDRVEIETPCEIPWASMRGDDRIRYCGHCRQNVYNVEALPRREAMALITAREGRVCLRIYRRTDGTVVTADCWSRLRAARRKGVWAFVAMLFIVGWAELAAIVVGIAGLRRWVGHSTMGATSVPVTAPLPPPPPLPPQGPGWIVGEKAIAEDASVAPPKRLMGKRVASPQPAPKDKRKPHPARPAKDDGVQLMGLMRIDD